MSLARRTELQIKYNNKNISSDIATSILGWTFTDNMSNKSDDFQLDLEDKDELWIGDWAPEKGANLECTVIKKHEYSENDEEKLKFGTFEIDEIEFGAKPNVISIKSLSLPESKKLRGERKNGVWEKAKLSSVIGAIAKRSNMKLFFDSTNNPTLDRVEQLSETDLEFLTRICSNEGLCLKISNNQIVVFDEEKYEKAEIIDTIQRSDQLKNIRCRTTLTGIYKACRVQYYDSKKKKTISYTFQPKKTEKTDKVLVVNQRVESQAEAMRLAKKKLREANKEATKVTFTLPGNLKYLASKTVRLQGFRIFDGKYIIVQAIHKQSNSGYETTLSLRKCLEGY